MGKVQKMVNVFMAEAEVFGHEKYVDGKRSGEWEFVREIDVTVNSQYGESASISLTVDEAKEAVKVLQDAIKKASKSDKQIIAEEKRRITEIDRQLNELRLKQSGAQ